MRQSSQPHFHDHHIAPLAVEVPEARVPTDLDEYLFDLQGYLILKGLLTKAEVADANARIDSIPRSLARGGWHGWVQRENHPEHRGASYQQVYELGGIFERLIDHPGYINYVLRFIGGQGTYDCWHGPAFIDEPSSQYEDPASPSRCTQEATRAASERATTITMVVSSAGR